MSAWQDSSWPDKRRATRLEPLYLGLGMRFEQRLLKNGLIVERWTMRLHNGLKVAPGRIIPAYVTWASDLHNQWMDGKLIFPSQRTKKQQVPALVCDAHSAGVYMTCTRTINRGGSRERDDTTVPILSICMHNTRNGVSEEVHLMKRRQKKNTRAKLIHWRRYEVGCWILGHIKPDLQWQVAECCVCHFYPCLLGYFDVRQGS